ncbi:Acetate kinase [Dissostichus eleginoides]|uniref:Acetate kinase n=1 Tax=Dissostichus eleginoides TaxID=100907 RepID=A0AAD9C3H0_DISEL|nr:Acetate kinase [Dissostichus eleginoides]
MGDVYYYRALPQGAYTGAAQGVESFVSTADVKEAGEVVFDVPLTVKEWSSLSLDLISEDLCSSRSELSSPGSSVCVVAAVSHSSAPAAWLIPASCANDPLLTREEEA